MTDPTLTISISRSTAAGGPTALVFDAQPGATLGIVAYQPPGLQQRITYAPDSMSVHGSEAIGTSWQQALLTFDWVRDGATSESDVQTSYAEVAAALAQMSYTVTTQVSGAPAQVWAADPGSLAPSARTYVDLVNPGMVVYSVSIPVYPIAS